MTENPPTPNAASGKSEKSTYGRRVPAVDQTLRVLRHLATAPERATLTNICTAVGIHPSKGHAILNTLGSAGMVVRARGAKTYSLGPGVLTLARAYLDRNDIASAAAGHLRALADDTGATALLGVASAGRLVIVAREEAPSGLAVTIRVGHRYPLTWGAHGKALLAFSSPERRAELLASGPPLFYQPGAMPSEEEVQAELDDVRRSGFAADVGGMQAGVSAVCAPLVDARGEPGAVLILVGTFPVELVPERGRAVAAATRRMNDEIALLLEMAE